MLTPGTTHLSQGLLRKGANRVDARASVQNVPLFTADEAWSRTNADRRVTGEKDDLDSILEPGFWVTGMIAFLPTVAGSLYLFLTQG